MITEQWAPWPRNPRYSISNTGKVTTLSGRERKNDSPVNGYYRANMLVDGEQKKIQVHRMVAETFLPEYEENCIIEHIDGNRLNNNIDNLRIKGIIKNDLQLELEKLVFRIGYDRALEKIKKLN